MIIKKVVSVVTSIILLVSCISLPDLSDGVKELFLETSAVTRISTNITVDTLKKLYQLSADYQTNPNSYSRANIKIQLTDNLEISHTKVIEGETMTWYPLGTSEKPFGGQLTISTQAGMTLNIAANEPLFDYIYDSVEIANTNGGSIQINLNRSTSVPSDDTKPMFANHVVHDSATTSTLAAWDIKASGTGTYSGIIGVVGTGSDAAKATINLALDSSADVVANASDDGSIKDVGLVCGTINKDSTVDVYISSSSTGSVSSVKSSYGNAGGFVGSMNKNSSLNVYLDTGSLDVSSPERTIEGNDYAGSLVGYNDQGTVTINQQSGTDENDKPIYTEAVYQAKGNVYASTASGSAGGVFGYYKIPTDNNRFSPEYYKSDTGTGCTLKGKTAGGLVGVLDGNGLDVSYSGTSGEGNRVTVKSSLGAFCTNYGGIVGSYQNNSLKRSFICQYANVEMNSHGATNYGGVAASLGGSYALYVKVNEFTLNSKAGANECSHFGGVIGTAGDKGSLLDIGSVKVKTSNGFNGGGVVGVLTDGVVRLSGTTDLSEAFCSGASKSNGQLVGQRKTGLVYALGSGSNDTASYENGWRFVRSNTDSAADDIGTWGEVLRISGAETKDPAENADTSNAILVYKSSAHTVTVGTAVTNMRSASDFTRTALNMQLNDGDKGALKFNSGSNRTNLLPNTSLTVFGTIDLTKTGITGFMRDGSSSNADTEIKSFTGKLSKGSANEGENDSPAVIKLAVGERYGISNGSEVTSTSTGGKGAIYAHGYNGLFARTGEGAEIENITVSGYMNINAKIDDIYIGGAIAYLSNGAKLTAVKASETINYNRIDKSKHYVGGLIGITKCDAGKNVEISGTSASDKATISPTINVKSLFSNINNTDRTVAYQAIGGLIGYISSTDAATTSVENITLSATIDASSATAVAEVSTAGLIADIAWNSTDTRKLTLSNIDVINTSIKNTASNTTGGILGYRWFGTDVTFDAVVLSSGNELNTNAKYIGGLVFNATGHWTVNNTGIAINSIAFKNAGGTATADPTGLGMIVHDGYYSSYGLFLELNAVNSYSLAAGLSNIPDMSADGKIYDELCACLSKDQASLLTNNTAGVISYNTGDSPYSMEGAGTKNSYNNKYNETVVNNRSRYYYNADIESYETNKESNDSYKLLYWSLNRYAAGNIKHCFENPYSTDVLDGTYDLYNISYYPIDISADVKLSNASITFYNADIEETEIDSDTKRSTRDGESQHYLMHMGLFKNVTKKITTTGTITLSGSVGVDSTYSGALICGELTGTLKTNRINLGWNDSDDEEENRALTITDTSRFLLINKIGNNAILELYGVYVNKYAYDTSDGTTYASSLIGDVHGTGINLKFNNLRIDSRNKEGVSIKGTSYGTTRSIFENAVLLNKFDVDSTSVAIYNFAQSEDWKSSTSRKGEVAYGKELTDTVEFKDNGKSEENRYYESNGTNGNYINPITYPGDYNASTFTEPLNTPYSFSEDFLPYVRYYHSSVSGAPTATYTLREIKVNVVPSDLKDGCGTYDHPYEIGGPKQLKSLALMIDGQETGSEIQNIMLPETDDGTHWCCTATNNGVNTHSCYLFTYKNGQYEYYANETDPNPTYTWSVDDVRKYLASAYYMITSDISLDTFKGLGGLSSEYAFKGVIVGKNAGITITNKSQVPFIRISNGSVIKDLTIVVDNYNTSTKKHVAISYSGSASTAFSYANNDLVYGGVIGKIMGGDNIIDNVKVTYSSNNTAFIQVQDKYLSCIGGYVGAVVNGGLVFRNMTGNSFASKGSFKVNASGVSNAANWINSTDTAHLYVNPYVGRVINGYVINETTGDDAQYSGDVTGDNKYTLDNGTKNYQIADVKADVAEAKKLYYDTVNSGYRVNIPDGQALFILSLITQSGAGTATTADGDYAYAIGYDGTTKYNNTSAASNVATHLAKYTKVGTAVYTDKTAAGSDYDVVSKNDKLNQTTAVPYIIYHYTKADTSGTTAKYPARMMTGNTEFMKLSTQNGTYNLPESFRGIGSICRFIGGSTGQIQQKGNFNYTWVNQDEDGKFSMKIYGFEGNGSTINVNLDYKIYLNEVDNYSKTIYTKDNINLGFGLFNYVIQKSDATTTMSNALGGKHGRPQTSEIPNYNLTENYYIGNFTLSGKVKVSEYKSDGTAAPIAYSTGESKNQTRRRFSVGGVIGALTINNYVNLFKLHLSNMTVEGANDVGGYIGRNNVTERNVDSGLGMNYIYANACNATNLKVTAHGGYCGGMVAGGLSGFLDLFVNTAPNTDTNDTANKGADGYYKSSLNVTIKNNTNVDNRGTAGVLGAIRNGYMSNLWINNVSLSGNSTDPVIENSNNNNTATCGAGGLIGYVRKGDTIILTNCNVSNINISGPSAGGLTGCIAYDTGYEYYGIPPVMKIYNCKVFDNDENTAYSISGRVIAGGIAGNFMSNQSYSTAANAKGYDYDSTKNNVYRYDIDGCEVYGYTIVSTADNDDNNGAGGIIGYAAQATRTIVNSRVHDCIIQIDGSQAKHGMGGIVGNTAIAVWGYNIAAYNNAFAPYNSTGANAKYGGFVGNPQSQELKVVGFTRKNNKYNNTLFDNDRGDGVTSGYIIDADYMNVSTDNDNHGTAMAVGFDNGTNVSEGAAKNFFPYVTVSPKVAAGGNNFLTGDGVSIVNNAPLASLITTENSGTAADNRIAYKTVSDYDIAKVKQMITDGADTSKDSDIKLTTYFTEMGRPTGYEGSDFPIIAINGGQQHYNDEINAYIRTLTNTTDDYTQNVANKFNVVIYPCQCKDGVYQKVSGTSGFQLDNTGGTGYYKMVDSAADSIAGKNQISMIDISFLDPTDNTKTAYHLYIPVLTKKMLKFNFSSSALQGTEYEPSVYRSKFPSAWNTNSKLAASFDSWQTMFVQFDYTKAEIDGFLKTGKGLDWNTSKYLYFKYNGDKTLAASTEFVLLDNNNNADKEYYIKKSSIQTATDLNKYDIIKLSDFKTTRNKATQIEEKGFEPQKLNDIAGTRVVCSIDNTSGSYVKCSDQTTHEDSVIYAYDSGTKTWFKPYVEGDTGDRYKIEVTGDISETYYLSMYTYSKDNTITDTTHNAYGFVLECPMTFTGDVITCQREKYKNTEVYLGNFLKQTLYIDNNSVVKNEKISSENHVLTATLKATLEFDGTSKGYFHERLAGENIYQGFLLYLNRYDRDGYTESDCSIKTMPEYSYTRKLNGTTVDTLSDGIDDGEPYLYIEPITITVPDSTEESWQSEQEVAVTLTFSADESKLVNEFPTRSGNDDEDVSGIGFDATAKLDFVPERVPYSNLVLSSQSNPDERYYIDKTGETGKLTLTALDQPTNDEYDPYGEQSKNKSSLGINAKYISEGSKYSVKGDTEYIKIGMDYDVSVLPDYIFDGNHSLELTIKLYQKKTSSESPGYIYDPVNIENVNSENLGYLEHLKIFGIDGSGELVLTSVQNGGDGYLYYTYSMTLPASKQGMTIKYTDNGSQKHFNATIEFDVKTATKLEAISGYKYANYKFEVSASISGTTYTSKDHIVYTNAKVNAKYVEAS